MFSTQSADFGCIAGAERRQNAAMLTLRFVAMMTHGCKNTDVTLDSVTQHVDDPA